MTGRRKGSGGCGRARAGSTSRRMRSDNSRIAGSCTIVGVAACGADSGAGFAARPAAGRGGTAGTEGCMTWSPRSGGGTRAGSAPAISAVGCAGGTSFDGRSSTDIETATEFDVVRGAARSTTARGVTGDNGCDGGSDATACMDCTDDCCAASGAAARSARACPASARHDVHILRLAELRRGRRPIRRRRSGRRCRDGHRLDHLQWRHAASRVPARGAAQPGAIRQPPEVAGHDRPRSIRSRYCRRRRGGTARTSASVQ